MPDGDIGALATTVRNPFKDRSKPDHPFGEDCDPAITNAILAYHSWSTQQSIHLHTPQTSHASGTLLGHQHLSSTCKKTQPPVHTASPAFGRRRRNLYQNHRYLPAQQNPTRPRRTSPDKEDKAHLPTKEPNLPAPRRPSNILPSPSPHETSRITTNCPKRGTTHRARQQHGDYRWATPIGRRSSRE